MSTTTWIVITAANLNDYKVGAMLTAARTAALASGQADTFSIVMADVTLTIRQKLRGAGFQVSATTSAVPPELKEQTCWLIIEKLLARLGKGLSLGDDEKTLLEDAKADIKACMEGKFSVSEPSDPESSPSIQSTTSPSTSERTRTYTRDNQDGM